MSTEPNQPDHPLFVDAGRSHTDMSTEPNHPDTDNTDVDPDEQKVTIQVRDGAASFGLTVLGASAGEVADEIERLQLEGQRLSHCKVFFTFLKYRKHVD